MQTKTTLEDILERLRAAQKEFEEELDRLLAKNREEFHYTLDRGKVIFENGVRQFQLQQRTGVWRYLRKTPLAFIASAPLIYGMFIPLALLDLSVTIYQHVCFRIYRIPLVVRSSYLVIDQHHLAYLNGIEKLNCMYCGYANGLISYAREIAARTEQYWCPIKHARLAPDLHHRVEKFFDYGDAKAWRKMHASLRSDWGEDSSSKPAYHDKGKN